MIIRNKEFNMNGSHTYIMGILNVTPDSFSDGGSYIDVDNALSHVEKMINEGADIIDIGGESTRPGHVQIPEEEEIKRVTEVIKLVRGNFDVPISIDTYKAPVARAALEAGTDIVNDIWGLQYDLYNREEDGVDIDKIERYSGQKMAEVVNEYRAPIILMHNDNLGRSLEDRDEELVAKFLRANECFESPEEVAAYIVDPENMFGDFSSYHASRLYHSVEEDKVVDRVITGLLNSVKIATEAGIPEDMIIVDPGIGFAKTQTENILTVKYLKKIVESVGFPMLLATSRKSMIGNVLELPPDQREEGTIVTTVMAVQAGCKFVRVHDVEKNARAIKMTEAILSL